MILNKKRKTKKTRENETIKKNTASVFLYINITTESTLICTILPKWLVEAMFVNFLSWATCDKEINNVGSG